MSALLESPFFGVTLTVIAYWAGVKIQRRTGLVICNYMLVAVALLVAVLLVFDIPYEAYYVGGSFINMFLGPATACMAVSIYAKLELLKKNWLPVLAGCTAGVVTSMGSILLMCRLFDSLYGKAGIFRNVKNVFIPGTGIPWFDRAIRNVSLVKNFSDIPPVSHIYHLIQYCYLD